MAHVEEQNSADARDARGRRKTGDDECIYLLLMEKKANKMGYAMGGQRLGW